MTCMLDLGYIKGEPGEGLEGPPGPPGRNGSVWLFGYAAPSDGFGDPGDYYLDATNMLLYCKGEQTWGNPIVGFAKTVDAELSSTSENALQNKAIKAALDLKVDASLVSGTPTQGGTAPFSTGGANVLLQRIAKLDSVVTGQNDIRSANQNVSFTGINYVRKYGKTVFFGIVSNQNPDWWIQSQLDRPWIGTVPTGFRPRGNCFCMGQISIKGLVAQCGFWIQSSDGYIITSTHAMGLEGQLMKWIQTKDAKINGITLFATYEAAE